MLLITKRLKMELLKYLPFLSVLFAGILCFIGVMKWRDFEGNRSFNNYSKKSLFAYQMYEKTGFETFKSLGYEFGVASFTGDITLSPKQRSRLLAVADPVRAIQSFKKCKQFIAVEEAGITLFEWKYDRYKRKGYRDFWKIFSFSTYFVSMLLILVVPFYFFHFHPSVIEVISTFQQYQIILICFVFFCDAFYVGVMALLKGVKIFVAEKLINENVKARDVILSDISV